MAYQAGDTILDDEYNAFLTNTSGVIGINHTMGTGATVYGLGQAELATVQGGTDSGTTITAASWNALLTALDNIANHTNASVTARTQVTAGDTIAIKAAVATDLSTLAAAVAAGSTSATAVSAGSELQSSQSGTRYTGAHVVEHTVTFANANNMRFFFNAGGKIRVNLTRVGNGGSSATAKDSSVDEMISAMGNFDIASLASTRSGSGETLTTDGFAIGFQDVTTSYQTVFLLTQSSGDYTSMTLKGEIKGNATQGSTTNVTIKMSLTDADSGDGTFTTGNLDTVDVNANAIGTTDFATKLMLPTTAQGLDPVYTLSSSAETSNTTS
tara:strand:- start:1285 stop:2265 length:981 start_codon:yes stop_codon:yes gene_type:complete